MTPGLPRSAALPAASGAPVGLRGGEPSSGRVLVLANRVPYPLDDGWKRRTFHVLRGLAQRYRVTLVTYHAGDDAVLEALNESLGGDLEIVTLPPPRLALPRALLLGAITSKPYHVWKLRSAAMRSAIARVAARQSFDAAVVTMAHLYPYLHDLPGSTRRLVDTHNIDSLVLRRYAENLFGRVRGWYARGTAARLHRHEESVFRDADVVLVCSAAEREYIDRVFPGTAVEVVPNGVDTQGAFAPTDAPVIPGRLVFFGKMDYFPNADAAAWFAESILPLLRRSRSDVELCVIGPGAGDRLRALAAADSGIRIMGRVPDLRPVVGSGAVVVVPLRAGGGTRLKILEALSLGRPVVSTSLGAEGLDLVPGRDIVIADDPAGFAAAVLRLLDDPDRAADLGAAGRLAVRERFDWSGIEQRFLDILEAPRGT